MDESISYNGFRCNISFFNPHKERPLVLSDFTLLSRHYVTSKENQNKEWIKKMRKNFLAKE